MDAVVRISSKHQIVIPKEAREALKVGPGDRLLVETVGEAVVLHRLPESYARALRGLHKDIWQDEEATAYLRDERASWDR